MPANFLPDFLQQQREELKQKERDAKAFTRALNDWRRSTEVLRDEGAKVVQSFRFTQSQVMENWQLTALEKRMVFDPHAQPVEPAAGGESTETNVEDAAPAAPAWPSPAAPEQGGEGE